MKPIDFNLAPLDVRKREAHFVRASKLLVDWLLSMNTHNRAPKKKNIEFIVREIWRNEWVLTNQGIGVSADGLLLDGQNRLIAIRECGYPPVDLLVVTGLDKKAQSVIDTGSARSQKDLFKLVLNEQISNSIISALRTLVCLTEDFHIIKERPTLNEMVEKMEEVGEELSAICEAAGSRARGFVIAAFVEYARHHNLQDAIEFAEMVRTGENLVSTDPAYRVRAFLESRKLRYSDSIIQAKMFRTLVYACIAHANRKQVTRLTEVSSWAGLPRQRLGRAG